MFSELAEDRSRFSPYYESMADSIFHPSSDVSDFNFESPPYSSNSDDFADAVDYEKMIDLSDELLLPYYMKYDIEKQPQLLNLVPPNDILPVQTSVPLDTLSDPFIRSEMFSHMLPNIHEFDGIPEVTEMPPADIQESLEQIDDELIDDDLIDMIRTNGYDESDQFLSDKFISEIAKDGDGASLDNIIEEEILPFLVRCNSSDSIIMSRNTYHPDYDHCYSKVTEDKEDVWTSVGSPDSSGSSSEEVDVVTVTEELQAPFVPKVQVPFRKRKRGQKSQKGKKNQNSLSPKTFNAAMKRNMTRITTIRRTYRRKINNSVETTPSNSLPSSAPSSRCSSDVEDAGKRANHNSSERKRREVLRTALQNLRLCVPGVQSNLKAPKVQILNCAKEFIREMKVRDQECVAIKKNLKSKRRSLEMKFKSLATEMNLC